MYHSIWRNTCIYYFCLFKEVLLFWWPRFMSCPLQMDETSFTMTFFGEGYSEGQNPANGKPNVKICTQVKGPGTYDSS